MKQKKNSVMKKKKDFVMMSDDDRAIIAVMLCYGDDFTHKLAIAAMAADDDNLTKIKAAFPELWKRWEEYIATSDFIQTY